MGSAVSAGRAMSAPLFVMPAEPSKVALRGQSTQAASSGVLQGAKASSLAGVASAGAALVAVNIARRPTVAQRTARRARVVVAPTAGLLSLRFRQRSLLSPKESPPFDPSKQLGVLAPLGFFDPLGFCAVGDEAVFRKVRTAELKHGRVAMLASIGAVGQHFIRLPGCDATGTFHLIFSLPGFIGAGLLLAACKILEQTWTDDPSKLPDAYGNPLRMDMYTTEMQNRELSNGRMAMISVLGIFAAEVSTGKDAIEQLGF